MWQNRFGHTILILRRLILVFWIKGTEKKRFVQDVDRALELANEMSTRNIERNVHTYTVSHPQHTPRILYQEVSILTIQAEGYSRCILSAILSGPLQHQKRCSTKTECTTASQNQEINCLQMLQALMNVCIKCGRCPLALETYHKMRHEGCAANVVTFNTLIDVYGKMGQWEQANKIPSIMKGEVRRSWPVEFHKQAEALTCLLYYKAI